MRTVKDFFKLLALSLWCSMVLFSLDFSVWTLPATVSTPLPSSLKCDCPGSFAGTRCFPQHQVLDSQVFSVSSLPSSQNSHVSGWFPGVSRLTLFTSDFLAPWLCWTVGPGHQRPSPPDTHPVQMILAAAEKDHDLANIQAWVEPVAPERESPTVFPPRDLESAWIFFPKTSFSL